MKTSVKSVFAALAAATLALTSCVSDNGEPKKGNNDVNNEYATLFINTFGKPAANQDWGNSLARAAVNTTAGIYEMKSSAPTVKWTNPDGNNWYQISGFKYENIPVDVTPEEEAEAVKQLSDPNVQSVTTLISKTSSFSMSTLVPTSTQTATETK